jgi:hypothetical protein
VQLPATVQANHFYPAEMPGAPLLPQECTQCSGLALVRYVQFWIGFKVGGKMFLRNGKQFGFRFNAQQGRMGKGSKASQQTFQAVAVQGRRAQVQGTVLHRNRFRYAIRLSGRVNAGEEGLSIPAKSLMPEGQIHCCPKK